MTYGLGALDPAKLARKMKTNKLPKPEKEGDAREPNPFEEEVPKIEESTSQRIKRKVKEKKRKRGPSDPVQKGRCAAGTWGYGLLAVAGIVFFSLGATAEPIDIWEMCSAGFLFLQAMYTIVFLGGDPCLIEGFREALNEFQTENNRLKESNNALTKKLDQLEGVTSGLEDVYKQMDHDIDGATAMLVDMERFSNLHTATSVVLQFFTCDTDRDGTIKDFEAEFFGPQFTRLWDLVGGDYPQDKFVDHVKSKGLSLHNLSYILEALINDDKAGCIHELNRLVGDIPPIPEEEPQVIGQPIFDEEAPANPFEADVRAEGAHGAAPPHCSAAAANVEGPDRLQPDDAEADFEWQGALDEETTAGRVVIRLAREVRHAMIAPQTHIDDVSATAAQDSAGAQQSLDAAGEAAGKDGALELVEEHERTPSEQDRFEREQDAKRCCARFKKHRGPLEPCMDLGFMKIWGIRHLCFIIAALGGLVFLGASIVIAELSNIICSLVSTSLAVGLMASSRLLYVLSALKKQLRFLRHENDRLEVINEELAEKIIRLQSVQKGFEVLRTRCEGNVEKGKDLIRKSNLNIISTAHAVVNYLFQRAAKKDRTRLSGDDEIQQFANELEEVFRSVPNFDDERVRAQLRAKGLSVRELKAFVEALTSTTKPSSVPSSSNLSTM